MGKMDMGKVKMAFFPWEPGSGKANGSICQSAMHIPSAEGSIIYLNANPDLANALSRIEKAGGKILQGKTEIYDFGFMAYFCDTEGRQLRCIQTSRDNYVKIFDSNDLKELRST